MTIVALEGLWAYLQTLNLTANNQKWLAERLNENTRKSASVDVPNAKTVAAIKECQSGKIAGTLDVSSFDAFNKSLQMLD